LQPPRARAPTGWRECRSPLIVHTRAIGIVIALTGRTPTIQVREVDSLADAIADVLIESPRPLLAREIAALLNERKIPLGVATSLAENYVGLERV
jgi:hypothetical protein